MSRDDYATRKSPSNSSATSRRSVSTNRWTTAFLSAASRSRVKSSMSEASRRAGRWTFWQLYRENAGDGKSGSNPAPSRPGAAIMRDAERLSARNGAQYLQTVDDWKEPRLPTQTVLRPDTRCIIAGEQRFARFCRMPTNIWAVLMNMRQRLAYPVGDFARALEGVKCHRRRFSAHENSRSAACQFDALKPVSV